MFNFVLWPDKFSDRSAFVVAMAICMGFLVIEGMASWSDNDGSGYVWAAERFLSGEAVWAVPGYEETAIQPSLLRLPGYALIIALFKVLFGTFWQEALTVLNFLLTIFASFALYKSVGRICTYPILGYAGMFVFLFSYQTYFSRFVLTDAVYNAVLTILICALCSNYIAKNPFRAWEALFCGSILCFLMIMREASLVMMFCLAPLIALCVFRQSSFYVSVRNCLIIFGMPIATLACVATWNYIRVGEPVLSTGGQTGFVFYLTQLDKQQVEAGRERVLSGDTPIDIVGRRILSEYDFGETAKIVEALRAEYGWSSVKTAKEARERVFEAWLSHPVTAISRAIANFENTKLNFISNYIYYGFYSDEISRDYYSYYSQLWYVGAIIGVPFIIFSIFFLLPKSLMPIVFCLSFFVITFSLFYSIFHLEPRYIMFGVGVAVLNLSLLVRSAREAIEYLLVSVRCLVGYVMIPRIDRPAEPIELPSLVGATACMIGVVGLAAALLLEIDLSFVYHSEYPLLVLMPLRKAAEIGPDVAVWLFIAGFILWLVKFANEPLGYALKYVRDVLHHPRSQF